MGLKKIAVLSTSIAMTLSAVGITSQTHAASKINSSAYYLTPPGEIHPEYGALRGDCQPGPGKVPDWIDSTIDNELFYKNWLKTTTTLCVNLQNIKSDQVGTSTEADEIHWRNDNQWIFRGSGSTYTSYPSIPDIFNKGIFPWKPDGGHLTFRPRVGEKKSGISSTSYSFNLARMFAANAYIINAPGGVDLDKTLDSWEQEIAFPGGIAPQYIQGVFLSGNHVQGNFFSRWISDDYFANRSYYNYHAAQGNQFDLHLHSQKYSSYIDQPGEYLAKSNPFFTVNGIAKGEGIHRLKDNEKIKIVAMQESDGKKLPADIRYWYVAGLGVIRPNADEDPSCIMLPGHLQQNQNMLVQAAFGPDDTLRTSSVGKRCMLDGQADGFNLRDKYFTDYATVKPFWITPLAPGQVGGWTIHVPGARLHSAAGASTGSTSQAMELGWQDKQHIDHRSQISQVVRLTHSDPKRNHIKSALTFRYGNNPQPWCAKPEDTLWNGVLKSGSQDFDVVVTIAGSDTLVAQRDFKLGTSAQFLVDDDGKNSRMNPGWKYQSLGLFVPVGAKDVELSVKFISKSQDDACHPIISDVNISTVTGKVSILSERNITGPKVVSAGELVQVDAVDMLGSYSDATEINWRIEPKITLIQSGPVARFTVPAETPAQNYRVIVNVPELGLEKEHIIQVKTP